MSRNQETIGQNKDSKLPLSYSNSDPGNTDRPEQVTLIIVTCVLFLYFVLVFVGKCRSIQIPLVTAEFATFWVTVIFEFPIR